MFDKSNVTNQHHVHKDVSLSVEMCCQHLLVNPCKELDKFDGMPLNAKHSLHKYTKHNTCGEAADDHKYTWQQMQQIKVCGKMVSMGDFQVNA